MPRKISRKTRDANPGFPKIHTSPEIEVLKLKLGECVVAEMATAMKKAKILKELHRLDPEWFRSEDPIV